MTRLLAPVMACVSYAHTVELWAARGVGVGVSGGAWLADEASDVNAGDAARLVLRSRK